MHRTRNEQFVYDCARQGDLEPLLARLRAARLDDVLPEPEQNITQDSNVAPDDLWAAVESEWFDNTLTDAQYQRCKDALYRRT